MIYIILIIVVILLFFFSASQKDKREIKSKGGLHEKYKELIEYILIGDLNANIIKNNDREIRITAGGPTTNIRYIILWSFNTITIEYTIDSISTGHRKFELVFNDKKDQEEMYTELLLKIENLLMIY